MDIVIDRSALISAIVGEPERERIIELTTGNSLIGPGSIPWEIGNAFSAMFKQKRLTLAEAEKGLSIFKGIPLRYIDPNFVAALKLSKQANIKEGRQNLRIGSGKKRFFPIGCAFY